MGINFKRSVAIKFKAFARQQEGSYSVVLDQMLWFFEKHNLTPEDQLPTHLLKTEKKLLQRMNTIIGIIKDIEKKQTLPTVGMLQALFEAAGEGDQNPSQPPAIFDADALEAELRKLDSTPR